GYLVQPTLFKRDATDAYGTLRVLSARTSDQIRYMLRLNAMEGSARRANTIADGYRLGAKTGTAEKVVNGRYTGESVTTNGMTRPVLSLRMGHRQQEEE